MGSENGFLDERAFTAKSAGKDLLTNLESLHAKLIVKYSIGVLLILSNHNRAQYENCRIISRFEKAL